MSKGNQLEGFCMDLLSEVAKKVGFKYKVQLVKDKSYGRQDENGNWNGMIGEVVRGVSLGVPSFRKYIADLILTILFLSTCLENDIILTGG